MVDQEITTLHPAQLLEAAAEDRYAGLSFWLVLGVYDHHTDAMHAVRLLRPRRERQRRGTN
jgi:hypothetical protein